MTHRRRATTREAQPGTSLRVGPQTGRLRRCRSSETHEESTVVATPSIRPVCGPTRGRGVFRQSLVAILAESEIFDPSMHHWSKPLATAPSTAPVRDFRIDFDSPEFKAQSAAIENAFAQSRRGLGKKIKVEVEF